MIAIALGGMAAEEMFFGESGTGPGAATSRTPPRLAAHDGRLVRHGRVAGLLRGASHEGPIDGANLVGKVLGDAEGKRARGGHPRPRRRSGCAAVLEENRDVLEALRDALIERDELVGDEHPRRHRSTAIAGARPLTPVRASRSRPGSSRTVQSLETA